jgi:hypothetical protein
MKSERGRVKIQGKLRGVHELGDEFRKDARGSCYEFVHSDTKILNH